MGEPTNPARLGEMIKIGRRGSLNVELTALGKQGHTAYPQLADNAAHRMVRFLDAILSEPLDEGSAHFQPSTIEVSTIDVGNPARNVIPGGGHRLPQYPLQRQAYAGQHRGLATATARPGGRAL